MGIDAHVLGDRRGGIERFLANLIPALRAACDHRLVVYTSHPEAADGLAGEGLALARHAPGGHLGRILVSLPRAAVRDRLDVLLVQWTGPPLIRCPVVSVIHDAAFARTPSFFTPVERLRMRLSIPFTAHRAGRVVTVSQFSKEELVATCRIPPSRIVVAPDGIDPVFLRPPTVPPPVSPPFFLMVGNLQPRKNAVTAVRAFRSLLAVRPDLPERLVIVGRDWYRAEDLRREAGDLVRAGRVVFTGYLPDQELVALMAAATAMVYPSVYEGFGLPVLEAMAARLPVLVADIPVMAEVAGDAAMRLPPTDPRAWAEAMLLVREDPSLRRRMVEAGAVRAAGFTWERCAREVLRAMEEAAEEPRRRRPAGRGRPAA